MDSSKKFYVTTPIYYVTARPHLGSLYSTVLADVAARWAKLQDKKTFFLTGTDEHGQKIAQAAEKAGKQPKEFTDSFISDYKQIWAEFEIEYNRFIRTTDEFHVKAVQQWLTALINKGEIYKGFYEGWYCTSCETYVTEEIPTPSTAQPPLCHSCGRPTHFVSEESYFFKLSAYQDRLLKLYQEHPEFIVPKERAHEVINFVKSGLKDLSISRTTITWGIPFPGDSKHVTYVWADALNNYITGVGYGWDEKEFKKWWPADLHILGKDIIRFHAVYWPAFLMATGLALPKQLLVHGWIKVGEQKMSKSLGNVVDPQVLYNAYGADPVRYYLLRQLAITHDGEFSIADLEQKITSDLANDLGNLLNRMITLAEKNNVLQLPAPATWSKTSMELQDAFLKMHAEYQEHMNGYLYHLALAALWKYIGLTNAYFHAHEPWKLAKSDPKLFSEVLSAAAHSLYAIGVLLWPVMPQKMELLLAALGKKLPLDQNYVEQLKKESWNKDFALTKGETLFMKIEPQLAEAKPEELKAEEQKSNEVKGTSSGDATTIKIDDFTKVELLVGTVTACDEVPKSDKLYKLQVDFGSKGTRQILSGVRKHFAAADLIGKQGVFVYNLAPRAMVGLESQGMMLFAEDHAGKLQMVTVGYAVPNGTKIR
jgi:methionyl-tRNA synthetase